LFLYLVVAVAASKYQTSEIPGFVWIFHFWNWCRGGLIEFPPASIPPFHLPKFGSLNEVKNRIIQNIFSVINILNWNMFMKHLF